MLGNTLPSFDLGALISLTKLSSEMLMDFSAKPNSSLLSTFRRYIDIRLIDDLQIIRAMDAHSLFPLITVILLPTYLCHFMNTLNCWKNRWGLDREIGCSVLLGFLLLAQRITTSDWSRLVTKPVWTPHEHTLSKRYESSRSEKSSWMLHSSVHRSQLHLPPLCLFTQHLIAAVLANFDPLFPCGSLTNQWNSVMCRSRHYGGVSNRHWKRASRERGRWKG